MDNQKAQQIANSITMIAHLPEGDALVHILGNGDEKKNIDAVSHWIHSQLDILTLGKPDFIVEQLVHRLHNKLDDFSTFFND